MKIYRSLQNSTFLKKKQVLTFISSIFNVSFQIGNRSNRENETYIFIPFFLPIRPHGQILGHILLDRV